MSSGPATLAGSLQQWLADPLTRSCAVAAPPGATAGAPVVRVEPLVLVAASGGGIRAAWWAVHMMTMLAGTQCGRHGVFAVSSVSGGSVGMGVLATSPHPGPGHRQGSPAPTRWRPGSTGCCCGTPSPATPGWT